MRIKKRREREERARRTLYYLLGIYRRHQREKRKNTEKGNNVAERTQYLLQQRLRKSVLKGTSMKAMDAIHYGALIRKKRSSKTKRDDFRGEGTKDIDNEKTSSVAFIGGKKVF